MNNKTIDKSHIKINYIYKILIKIGNTEDNFIRKL